MADFDAYDRGMGRDVGTALRRAHPQTVAAAHGAHEPWHERAPAPEAPAARPRPALGRVVGWGGALISLGLVVGMVWWAAHLALRDVSGVPVIRALEGPMRVAPAEPGGTQADHQGLAVNRIAEGVEAAPVPDRLVLAPPPVELDPTTLAAALPPVPADADAQASEAGIAPTPEAINAGTHELIARLMARAEGEEEGMADGATAVTASASGAGGLAPGGAQVIPASVAGVARSMRPAARPFRAAAAAATGAAQAQPVVDVDPATLTEGTRLVQLGAFDTPEIARTEWDRLIARFPDYFQDRARVIEQANSGGAPFYRLRAMGFDDLAAARRFCAVLMAQNAPCVPVTVR